VVIDWNVVSSVATAIASLATALGVCFGAWQIKVGKDQAQATFEDSLINSIALYLWSYR